MTNRVHTSATSAILHILQCMVHMWNSTRLVFEMCRSRNSSLSCMEIENSIWWCLFVIFDDNVPVDSYVESLNSCNENVTSLEIAEDTSYISLLEKEIVQSTEMIFDRKFLDEVQVMEDDNTRFAKILMNMRNFSPSLPFLTSLIPGTTWISHVVELLQMLDEQ